MKNHTYLKNIFNIILTVFTIIITQSVHSQSQFIIDTSNSFVRNKAHYVDTFGTIYWKCDSLEVGTLFNFKNQCGLQSDDSMHFATSWHDSITGLTTNIYHQYYKGIRVEHSDYTELYDANGVYLTTGWIAEALNKSSSTSFNDSSALSVVMNYLNAEKYSWEDSVLLNPDSCDLDTLYNPGDTVCFITDYYPVGELVFYNKFKDKNPNNYILAWRYNSIYVLEPYSDKKWYVDANTGQILDSTENDIHNDASHWYYGNVSFDAKWYGGTRQKFTTEANTNHRNISTRGFTSSDFKNFSSETEWVYKRINKNTNSSWGTNSRDETSTHYVVSKAWDFFAQEYNHVGFSNNYSKDWLRIAVYPLGSTSYKMGSSRVVKKVNGQLMFNIEYLVFAKSDGQLQCTYDHAGHEFAHIVNHHSKKLAGADRSQASSINEGFCDIFGFLTERFAKGTGWDWVMGADLQTNKVRSFYAPSATPFRSVYFPGNTSYPEFYPSIYFGQNWYSGNDALPHINSSVLSRCFNLLSVGGVQNGVTVNGIGVDKAGHIAFFTLRNLVHTNETYNQLREHMVAAAITLYGPCSAEVFETCRAWKACGIGDLCPCSPGGGSGVGDWTDPCRFPTEDPSNNETVLNELKNIANTIKVFPNPTHDIINISFADLNFYINNKVKIVLTSIDGRKLYESDVNISINENYNIKVSNLEAGVYIVSIYTKNDIYMYKIIKQ